MSSKNAAYFMNAGCEHVALDACGCLCHSTGTNHYGGCCRRCPICNLNIPKSPSMSIRAMAVASPKRPTSGVDSNAPLLDNAPATANQVAMVWAIAKSRGIANYTALFEWLEYESGLKIQIKRLEELRSRHISRLREKLEKMEETE